MSENAWGQILVSSLPLRNKFLGLFLKKCAKTDIKVFRYPLILFDF